MRRFQSDFAKRSGIIAPIFAAFWTAVLAGYLATIGQWGWSVGGFLVCAINLVGALNNCLYLQTIREQRCLIESLRSELIMHRQNHVTQIIWEAHYPD